MEDGLILFCQRNGRTQIYEENEKEKEKVINHCPNPKQYQKSFGTWEATMEEKLAETTSPKCLKRIISFKKNVVIG